jgi:hypothetical protein
LALSKKSALLTQCGGRVCSSHDSVAQSDISSLGTLTTVSTITFAVGGAALATGAALVAVGFTRKPADSTHAYVLPLVGPAFIGAEGTF